MTEVVATFLYDILCLEGKGQHQKRKLIALKIVVRIETKSGNQTISFDFVFKTMDFSDKKLNYCYYYKSLLKYD